MVTDEADKKADKEAVKGGSRRRRPRKLPSTPLPDGWSPSRSESILALESGIRDIERELEKFRDNHLRKGSVFSDWDAAWRLWLRNAHEFGQSRRAQMQAAPKKEDEPWFY